MALNYTDPNNPSADTSTDTTTSADWFSQNAPAGSAATFTPIAPPPNQAGIGGVNPTNGVGGGNSTDAQLFSYLLSQNTNNPQAAIDQFNQMKPGSDLHPYYYPDTKVIGVQGQQYPYLTAPGTAPGQTDWQFGGVPGGDSGGAVGSYSALARPAALSTPYTPATFGEKYAVPSVTDLMNDPGYQADAASVQRGLERGAAAKGSLLSGGFIGRTLPTALANFTSTAYKDLNDRNFQAYQSRYNQFLDSNNMALGARQLNENDYNTDVTNNLNQYLTRYGAYQDLIKNNLSYANLGLSATQAGAPTSAGTGA